MTYSGKPRDDSGALFKNKRKVKPGHPDFQGECLIGGRAYYISGWAKESAAGNRYTSLAFKPKAPPMNRNQGGLPVQRAPGEDDDQGELPC